MSGLTAGGSIVTSYTYDALGRRTSETLTRRLSAQNATPVDIDPSNLSRKRITDYVYETNGLHLQRLTVSGSTALAAE